MYSEKYEYDSARKSVNPTSCGCQWMEYCCDDDV